MNSIINPHPISLQEWAENQCSRYTDLFGARYGHKLAAGWRVESDLTALRFSNLIRKMLDFAAQASQAESQQVA